MELLEDTKDIFKTIDDKIGEKEIRNWLPIDPKPRTPTQFQVAPEVCNYNGINF